MNMNDIVIMGFVLFALSALMGWYLARQASRIALTNALARADDAQTRISSLEASLTAERRIYDQLQQTKQEIELDAERNRAELAAEVRRIRERDEQLKQLKGALDTSEQVRVQLTERASAFSATGQGERVRAQQAEALLLERQQELAASLKSLSEERTSRADAQNKVSELQTRLEEQQKQNIEARRQLEESKLAMKEEFQNLANEIFDAKGKSFSASSQQQLDGMLKPFREQVDQFRQRAEEIHGTETQQRAHLTAELSVLKGLNKQMTEEAHQLATALKGQKKTQGNWGELVLENVLDRSGLQQGKDYRREVSFNTEEGRKRPDAVVYLPHNRHLVIDAKVSLNAYTRYINADDELIRQQALKEHVSAISARIKELSDRSYFEIKELNSPDMVFMFIPIESAFVEALKAEPQLFEQAIQQNILVATPTTLLTSLNIVRQLWRFEDQNKHSAELADRALKVYNKLNSFLNSMTDLGKKLGKATETYDTAMGQLVNGTGNLVKQAAGFKELGVAVQRELPEELLERAELELTINEEPLLDSAAAAH